MEFFDGTLTPAEWETLLNTLTGLDFELRQESEDTKEYYVLTPCKTDNKFYTWYLKNSKQDQKFEDPQHTIFHLLEKWNQFQSHN